CYKYTNRWFSLSLRGFELFRASIMKNVKFHQQIEKKSLSQLKKSMQRIRSKQQKYKDGQKSSETSAGTQEAGTSSTDHSTEVGKRIPPLPCPSFMMRESCSFWTVTMTNIKSIIC
ncbi:hypothetical protein AMECASPLE_035043, partial [Ameca splendens]